MPRLASLPVAHLSPAQQALWDSVTNGSRAGAVDGAAASLPGPFDPWLRTPEPGLHAARIGEHLMHHGTLDPRLRELAVLAVAARHRADVVFASHIRVGRKAGLDPAVVDALRDGTELPPLDPAAAAVAQAVDELLAGGRWAEATYAAVLDAVGEAGAVELVVLVGYYTLVAYTVNAFEVGLPAGLAPVWAQSDEPLDARG